MGLPFNTVRSSSLLLPETLRGQERVLAIVRHFGASCYVNVPGGRALYDSERFADEGVKLQFLADYEGSDLSILHRLLTEDRREIGDEVRRLAVSTG